jgi:glyceraldehyde-3-phosphate dehydrogenase (NADP+)
MSVRAEELFGPAVCIEPYQDFQEALQLVNEGRYGLQAGLFTSLDSEIQEAFQNLDVGGLLINRTPTLRLDHMPYGGVKDSGLGREGVRYAMKDYCEPRLLVHPGW